MKLKSQFAPLVEKDPPLQTINEKFITRQKIVCDPDNILYQELQLLP